ncbi:MAG: lipid IV(A) 3-deoxy-D-manno-octulosonic acid transferase [Rhodocyclaceae bacterium]
MARKLYTLALYLLLPVLLARLAWRARRRPEYLSHLGERFGRYAGAAAQQPPVWLHAVSLGETRAAQPLVRELLQRHPQTGMLITHTTATGRAASRELFGSTVASAYLPYDFPGAVARFLDHFRPRLGLILETEIWPNLFAGCTRRGIPMVLVNARLSQRSARAYARLPALAREAFGALSLVCAQTEEDAERLASLGARTVEVTGNLKFDIEPPEAQLRLGAALRESIGDRPVLLLASTRDGEEAIILDALDLAALPARTLLFVVPRHPQRFDEVERLIAARGLACARRSAGRAIEASTRVLLGDTMGEMFAYYRAADVAFVGGSLLPLGGQNLIEACAVGTPVLIGPHTFNFTQASAQAIACGAARRVAEPRELLAQAAVLLADPAARAAMGDAGRVFARRHRGATARTLAHIERFLREPS